MFQPTFRQLLLSNGLHGKTSEFHRHVSIAVSLCSEMSSLVRSTSLSILQWIRHSIDQIVVVPAEAGKTNPYPEYRLFQREQMAVPSMTEEGKYPMECWCIRGSALVSAAGRLSTQQCWHNQISRGRTSPGILSPCVVPFLPPWAIGSWAHWASTGNTGKEAH